MQDVKNSEIEIATHEVTFTLGMATALVIFVT